MIPYPDKPWEDGQQFTYIDKNGEEVVGTYDAGKNAWSFTRLSEEGGGGGGGVAGVSSIIAGTGISVNQSTGDVTISATGSGGTGAVSSVNDKTGDVVLATSDLANDSGYITDAGVTSIVAGTNITVSDDGNGAVTINSTASGGETPEIPVDSVNGKTGAVVLDINDLDDVQIDSVEDGDVLQYDLASAKWTANPLPVTTLSSYPTLP